jgi:hypothetical protein
VRLAVAGGTITKREGRRRTALTRTMLASLKDSWKKLLKAPPGKRFEERYRARQATPRSPVRVLKVGAGVVLIVAGLALLLIPGPGSVVIVLGIALVGEESKNVARALDRMEVKLRAVIHALLGWWARQGRFVHLLVILLAIALLIGAAGVLYWYFIGW